MGPAEYIPLSTLAGGSSRVSSQYRAGAAHQYSPVEPANIPPEQLASLVLLNAPPGAQLGLRFMLVPSCFECALRLGKGDAFVLLWAVNSRLRFIPRRVSFWKAWLLLTEPMFEFSRSARRQVTDRWISRQYHQHRFQHPPHVQPTSPASPATRAGFLHLQHHQFLSGKVGRHLCMHGKKRGGRSGGVGGGGGRPPMVIKKVMIQLEAMQALPNSPGTLLRANKLKSSGGGGGG